MEGKLLLNVRNFKKTMADKNAKQLIFPIYGHYHFFWNGSCDLLKWILEKIDTMFQLSMRWGNG